MKHKLAALLLLATPCLSLWNAPQSLAASPSSTPYTFSQTHLSLNGSIISSPYRLVAHGTSYIPIYYVDQMLQKLGMTVKWAPPNWTITTAQTVTPFSLNGQIGTNNILLNGTTVVHNLDRIVAKEPGSTTETSFVPFWYVMQTLNHVTGMSNTWNGTQWIIADQATASSSPAPSTSTTSSTPSTNTAFTMPTMNPSGEVILQSPVNVTSMLAQKGAQENNTNAQASNGGTSAYAINVDHLVTFSGNRNFFIEGHVVLKSQSTYPNDVWVQLSDGNGAGTWTYPITVQPDGSYQAWLEDPFAAQSGDTLTVYVGPYMTSKQLYSAPNQPAKVNDLFNMNASADIVQVPVSYAQPQLTTKQFALLNYNWANEYSPTIQATAQQIIKGITDPKAQAQAIYAWVGENLNYNTSEINSGAYTYQTIAEDLNTHLGICVDFANLYSALARAAGIPTFTIGGNVSYPNFTYGNTEYVATSGSHMWDQSYVDGSWIYLDPTVNAGDTANQVLPMYFDISSAMYQKEYTPGTNAEFFLNVPGLTLY